MPERVRGRATSEGTGRFVARHGGAADMAGYRDAFGLKLSSIGIGTYLGDPTPEKDRDYRTAVEAALEGGINVIDTAINYRHMRSERAVGAELQRNFREGDVARDEVFISTKGGFLPFDDELPDPQAAVQREYVDTGLITQQNFAAGCHCMDGPYLEDQIRRSRENLGLETIDLYYLHNPETQFASCDEGEFYDRLRKAFVTLERAVAAGQIARYGLATWDGLRHPPGHAGHFELTRAVEAAASAATEAGVEHRHLAAVQAPLNLAMVETEVAPAQKTKDGKLVPLAEACRQLDLALFTSASILQGRLAAGVPRELHERFNFEATDAQIALQATRSAPGVTTALVGMSLPHHVDQAVQLMHRASPDQAGIWNGRTFV